MEISQVILEQSKNDSTEATPRLLTMFQVSQVLRIDRADIEDNEIIKCEAENYIGRDTVPIQIIVQCKLIGIGCHCSCSDPILSTILHSCTQN